MKNTYIKSPLNYVGGKYKLLPQIEPFFPKDIRYFVDLFCGGLNVGINVNAEKILANDIEKVVIKLFNYFKATPHQSIEDEIYTIINQYELSDTSKNGYEYYGCNSSDGVARYNKDRYLKLRDDYNEGKNSPLMFYVMLLFAFNNQIRFNSDGNFNMPVNKRDFNNSIKNNLKKFIEKLHEVDVNFTSKDFRELKVDKLNSDDFVYIDPPYLITVASYNEQNGWTEKDENDLYELCDKLNRQGVKFALSNVIHHKGKENNILIEWSKNYKIHNLNHNYANSNYQTKDKDKKSTYEVLITNY